MTASTPTLTAHPTWLGVAAASFAALFVYFQLRGQQKELTRQLAALERQQADDVDIAHTSAVIGMTDDEQSVNERCWSVSILNSSRRPIRNVAGRIEAAPGKALAAADYQGTSIANGQQRLKPGAVVDVLRKDFQANLAFDAATRNYKDARITVRFTDDADHHWQVDGDLHLTQLKRRDW